MLEDLENAFNSAWTNKSSSPFIADIRIAKPALDQATDLVRTYRLRSLFSICPTLAVWSVLYPLAKNYGADTRDVYLHISQFVGEDYEDVAARDSLKHHFRLAAHSLGLPVKGNDPTSLFFPPLGPARAQYGELARSFVGTALHLGPPAIEDTSSARGWQRRAVVERCPGMIRLRETVFFDTSAYCARRFEAWRQGYPPDQGETDLFEAYDEAAAHLGCRRSDIVGPPQIIWLGDGPGLEADRSRGSQTLRIGAFPKRISSGQRIRLPTPWPETIGWQAGAVKRDIMAPPAQGEVIAFDADTGTCIGRCSADQGHMEVAAERLVVLARSKFRSPTFGDAIPAADHLFSVAWVTSDEVLAFADRPDLSLVKPREDAIWLDCTVLGRDGTRALYASDGALILKINPEIGGSSRIVRARSGDDVRFAGIEVATTDPIRLDLSQLGLNGTGSPREVIFDVLAPGAAGDLQARADLSTRAWVWPGISSPSGDLTNVPTPANYDPARSAGLQEAGGYLSVDPRSDAEVPILGIQTGEKVHEFHLSARSEKLWHCRILEEDRAFIPHGATILLGQDNRHDTLMLRSPDREADLIVLGRQKRRPFIQRQSIEIGASELEPPEDGDDRIALRRSDGRVDVLARLRRKVGTGSASIEEGERHFRLAIVPQQPFDGLRIRIETVSTHPLEGDYSFSHNPSELSPVAGVTAAFDRLTGRIDIELDRGRLPAPARGLFYLRDPGGGHTQLRDDRGAPIAVGIPGMPAMHDLGTLTKLAQFLADPEPEDLSGQVSSALMPAYEEVFRSVGESGMVGSIKPVLNVSRTDGHVPRHDLVSVASWIFEAPPTAFLAMGADSGLAPLSQIRAMEPPAPLPSATGETPLGDWLARIATDVDLPEGLGSEDLQRAFLFLRSRLRDSDLHDLVGDGATGNATRLICAPHIEGLDQMRSFDTGGGGDAMPARIAAQVERYARACAEGRADAFVHDIAFRTGLPRAEVGRTITLMLRAGIEFFVYFRALWGHAFQR
jgi:hypothetical protein